MYIFLETTVLLDNEFYRVAFDENLAKLQSEICHTGVTCSHENNTSISISGPWDAVQRAYCTLLIQSKTANVSTDRVPATAENGDISKADNMSHGIRNYKDGVENKGLSATGTHVCRTCGFTFATRYFLRKHTCMVYCQSTRYSNSSGPIVNVEPELDPVVVTSAESESAQEITVPMYNEDEHNYHTLPRKCTYKRRTNVKPKPADVGLTVEELEDIMKNVCPNEYGIFICYICSYAGSTKPQLRNHILRNHIERRWRCEICGDLFGLKQDIIRHNMSCHTTGTKIQCPLCLQQYLTNEAFRLHMRLDHKERDQPKHSTEQSKYSLNLETNTSSTSETGIILHPRDKINTGDSELESAKISTPPSTSDTDISSSYVKEDELKELISNQAGSLQFSCPKCHHITYTEHSFREHIMRRHMERKFKCDICDKYFGLQSGLRQHKRFLHDVPVEVSCTVCKKSYPSKGSLAMHMAIHRRKWKCDTCSKCYVRQKDLETHQLIHPHTSTMPLNTCRICNHIFPTKYMMRRHMFFHQIKGELHEQENCFKCSLCSKNFTNPHNFNKHVAAHLKKPKSVCNPLPCSDCNKRFMSQKSLVAHKKTHNTKTVKCPLCPKTFLNKDRLTQFHLPFHSTKRDYICSVCGKGFPLKSPMIAHEKIHGDIRPYGCPHCKMTFKIHYDCKRHMVKRHDYHKQDYELIHRRMRINPLGLTLKDFTPDTETNGSNSENPDVVDDDGTKNLITLPETGASDTQQETEYTEMTNMDEMDIIHAAILTDHANVQVSGLSMDQETVDIQFMYM